MYDSDDCEEDQERRRASFPVVLCPAEVMDILGVGKNTVYRLLEQGRLKGIRIGRCWRIPMSALEEFM